MEMASSSEDETSKFRCKARMSSLSPHPPEMDAADHGWNMTEDKICWFDGDAFPQSLDACTIEHDEDCLLECHERICT